MSTSEIPKVMRGILVEETGGVEVLKYKSDLPVPTPGEGEILVKNEIMGINMIDTYYRKGLYSSPKPEILGREGAARVVALGPSVSDIKINDRVLWLATGGYAEYTATPAEKSVKITDDKISSADACAAFLQGITALTMAEESYHVEKGDWVMVTAASGGTGGSLCQIFRAKGAHIIAVVGSEPKVATAKENGADHVLDESKVDVQEETMKLTGGKGVAAVFDGVGKATFDRSLDCLAQNGSMLSFGNASGEVDPFRIKRLAPKNLKVMRPMLYGYVSTHEALEKYTKELFKLMEEGKYKAKIHHIYHLKDAGQAQTDLEGRKTMGKLLLEP